MGDGERECRGLAGARLRETDDVAPRQDQRNSLALNRRRRLIAGVPNRLQQFALEAELLKRRSSFAGFCSEVLIERRVGGGEKGEDSSLQD